MAEISRGRPLQGTDFILILLDAKLTKLAKEMNHKWKIIVIGHFWLFLAIFGKMADFLKKRSTQDKNSVFFQTWGQKPHTSSKNVRF